MQADSAAVSESQSASRRLNITLWRSREDTSGQPNEITWGEWADRLMKHKVRNEKDGPGFTPALFKKGKLQRQKENVEAITALVFDCDGPGEVDRLRNVIEARGLEAVDYSTWRSTPEAPRGRFVLPLTAPVPADEWEAFHVGAAFVLVGGLEDSAGKDANRFFWNPACPEGSQPWAKHHEGRWLDPDEIRAEIREEIRQSAPEGTSAPKGKPSFRDDDLPPGEDYKRRGSWSELLERNGWKLDKTVGDNEHWTRPGKDGGTSATLHRGMGCFYLFSTEPTEFEAARGYDLFGAYARLEHGGDISAAARALRLEGYGSPTPETAAVKRPGSGKAGAGAARATEAEEPAQSAESDQPTDLIPKLVTMTAPQLQAQHFRAPRWAIRELIPEGMSLFSGPSKGGKSWMCWDFCIAVATGGVLWESKLAEKGEVLYMALEDSHRRAQERMNVVLRDRPAPENLHICIECEPLRSGLEQQLEAWMEDHPDTRLIVIDVLQKVRPMKKNGAEYDQDYSALGPCQKLANDRGVAILATHHTKKGAAEDVIDKVNGSVALQGVADTILVLDRKRMEPNAKLNIISREFEADAIPLLWKAETKSWHLDDQAEDRGDTKERARVLEFLFEATETVSIAGTADALTISNDSIKSMFARMKSRGDIRRESRGQYCLTDRKRATIAKERATQKDTTTDTSDLFDLSDTSDLSDTFTPEMEDDDD